MSEIGNKFAPELSRNEMKHTLPLDGETISFTFMMLRLVCTRTPVGANKEYER